MKRTKFMALLLCITMVFSGCGNMNNTTKGGLIGGGGGAALGAAIGGIFGKGKKDIVIPWCNIEKIGEDIILVRADPFLLPGGECKDRCDPNIGSF